MLAILTRSLFTLAILAIALPAIAQGPQGGAAIKVTNREGDILPGATVALGVRGNYSLYQLAGPTGIATFQNLAPVTYDVQVTQESFVTANTSVTIEAGKTTDSHVKMTPVKKD